MEGVAVADGFRPRAGASVSTLTTVPLPAHQTQRADFPHWACMLRIVLPRALASSLLGPGLSALSFEILCCISDGTGGGFSDYSCR